MNNILDDLLGIDPKTITDADKNTSGDLVTAAAPPKPAPDPIVVADNYPSTTQDDDLSFARRKMRNMIKAAEDAVNELAEIAASTQQPRAYEVLANLIKTTSEATKELVATHKTKAEINRLNNSSNQTNFDRGFDNPINTGNQINVERAVFVGTASELLDRIAKAEIEQQQQQTLADTEEKAKE